MTPQQAKRDTGATHYTTMADGTTPQMYYMRMVNVLYYRTFAGAWHRSSLDINDSRLVPIEDKGE